MSQILLLMTNPVVPWNVLDLGCEYNFFSCFHEISVSQHQKKTFTLVLHNVCDIPLNQPPTPCIKGEAIVVKILEDEYKVGEEGCKTRLHGRILLVGDKNL